MNIKRERRPMNSSRLENEVILAVVIMYLLLSGALLAIHFAMPEGAQTVTSSTSPSHDGPAPQPPAAQTARPAGRTSHPNKTQD